MQQSNISLYPNPFNKELKIQTKTDAHLQVKIINLAGKIVSEVHTNDGIIDASDLSPGTYVMILIQNGIVSVQKLENR